MPDSIFLDFGGRGSPLSHIQMTLAVEAFKAASQKENIKASFGIKPFTTSGDIARDRSLADIGGKGLFSREIDLALLKGEIDIAVHSVKDLETPLAEGLCLAGFLPREDVRDSLISQGGAKTIAELPEGAVFGTSSPRRGAQIRHLRPDMKITLLRGNVGTRLAKIEAGAIDATLLAHAGLLRLDMADKAQPIAPDIILPCAGQGTIGLVIRKEDCQKNNPLYHLTRCATHAQTEACILAERAFLSGLGGSCHTPLGVYASQASPSSEIFIRARLFNPEKPEIIELSETGPAPTIGINNDKSWAFTLGQSLKKKAGHFPAHIFT